MITIILAFLEVKYEVDFKLLYFGTVLIDFALFETIGNFFSKNKRKKQNENDT